MDEEREIRKLRHEVEMLMGAGIIEVAVRNPNVAEYMKHWEDRALKAEAAVRTALAPAPAEAGVEGDAKPVAFQLRVQPWMMACFGPEISADRIERNHRFLEEALELVQSTGCTQSEAHQLVDYVYGRPVGETHQEIGGVMVTLAALCLAIGEDMHVAGETELARIWTKVEKIRTKQAAKPKHSPLPQHVTHPPLLEECREALRPFAKMANAWDDEEPDDNVMDWNVDDASLTLGQCRTARTLLTKLEAGR
ncbi:MAG: hypothetical protein ACTHJQ_12540 [Rhizobiaceae bacterium]